MGKSLIDLREKYKILADELTEAVEKDGIESFFENLPGFQRCDYTAISKLDSYDESFLCLKESEYIAKYSMINTHSELIFHFMDEYLRLLEHNNPDQLFEYLWGEFEKEFKSERVFFYGIALFTWINSELETIDLHDGISLKKMKQNQLFEEYPFLHRSVKNEFIWGREQSKILSEYFILYAEDSEEKKEFWPYTSHNSGVTDKINKAILSLRLSSDSMPPLIFVNFSKKTIFNSMVATSQWKVGGQSMMGPPLELTQKKADLINEVYELLNILFHKDNNKWGNIKVSLQHYSLMFQRSWHQPSDLLTDAITALEALVGGEMEIKYKLALRLSYLLAKDDSERVYLFEEMKKYYSARSKVIHGEELSRINKEYNNHKKNEQLKNILRRLLISMLYLVDSRKYQSKREFIEDLELSIVDPNKLMELRRAMNIDSNS